jgi:integrase
MLVSFGVKPPPRTHKRGRPAKSQGKPAPGQARNLLGIVKMFFTWVRKQKKRYGLTTNPCADLKAKDLCGTKMPVDRYLSDTEIAAFWRSVDRLKYPYGPLYKMLLLSGLRLNECADGAWSEIDFKAGIWIIPKERIKARNEKARAHAVPLSSAMVEIFEDLSRFKRGDFLFSNSFGENSVWVGNNVKKRLDTRMIRSLRALARMRGEDPSKVQLAAWTNHDLRRTLRSNLTRLRVDRETAEAILAHVKNGIVGTYDVHDHLLEKKDALELWATRVRMLVTPAPTNVVPLPARA